MTAMATSRPGVQERIFLHLRDFMDHSDKVEVPFALSQMGIANAVSIARSNVPRAISGMKEAGHLIERQAHVTGVSRKRKAYFLTDEGARVADDIWDRVSENSVRLINPDGQSVNTTISVALEETELPLRHVDMLRYMDESGTIDLTGLTPELIERDLSKHIEKQLVSYLNDLPRTRRFYGRTKEIDVMAELLDAKSASILVPGIAGIGKTSLSTKILDRFTHRRNLIYHRCQDWEGSRAFLEACAEWLSAIGHNGLSDYLSATPVPQPILAVNLIEEGLSESPSLIVIDDLHKVGDETLYTILRELTLRIPNLKEVGLVMFSRSFRMVVPESDQSGNIVTLVMPLQGLDEESSKQILTALPMMDTQQFSHIYTLSRGHPLILELINRGNVAETFHATLEAFVEQEIFSRLSGAEKRLLGAIAIFREPIPINAIQQAEGGIDLLDELVEKGLARQSDAENYDVHDLVREFLMRSMDEDLRNQLHSTAVNWYRDKEDATDRIEFIYHLRNTGDDDGLAEALLSEGRGLVSSGHTELLSILNSLESGDFDSRSWALIRELRGDVFSIQGRWDEAEVEYDAAAKHIGGRKPSKELARMLSARADIAVKRGAMDDALELHRNALQIQIEIRDAIGAAKSYNNMGHIFRRRRDIRRALEVYGNVEELLDKEDDPELNDARIRLASAFIEMGELDRAREHALTAYEDTKETEDGFLHARSRAVLGRFYAKISDNDLALLHYSGALETLSKLDDPQSAVEVEMLLGQVLVDAGRREEAAEHYLSGLAVAEANDFRVLQGEILARLGEVEPDRSQRMNYLQRSLSLFRELGAVDRMREVQNSVHRAVMGK
ncbi:MAG: tetratricopeptide repeat protein [Candidatus Thermoplasmatota archaeon]|nr:tetratricopeptide repeat protein [Candidatus Thermoplasmatota archaeon]|tara:strand:- start:3625 stop:6150 length:2526 start_codon:yes stop_codon:yes gene_type:complete